MVGVDSGDGCHRCQAETAAAAAQQTDVGNIGGDFPIEVEGGGVGVVKVICRLHEVGARRICMDAIVAATVGVTGTFHQGNDEVARGVAGVDAVEGNFNPAGRADGEALVEGHLAEAVGSERRRKGGRVGLSYEYVVVVVCRIGEGLAELRHTQGYAEEGVDTRGKRGGVDDLAVVTAPEVVHEALVGGGAAACGFGADTGGYLEGDGEGGMGLSVAAEGAGGEAIAVADGEGIDEAVAQHSVGPHGAVGDVGNLECNAGTHGLARGVVLPANDAVHVGTEGGEGHAVEEGVEWVEAGEVAHLVAHMGVDTEAVVAVLVQSADGEGGVGQEGVNDAGEDEVVGGSACHRVPTEGGAGGCDVVSRESSGCWDIVVDKDMDVVDSKSIV